MRFLKPISAIILLFVTTQALSFDLKNKLTHGRPVLQLGGYWSNQGQAQHINIDGLIGDDFTITTGHASNGLVGLGYYIDGQEKDLFNMAYGINAFYLAKTSVSGNVIQENLFTNLAYGYHVTHYPVYAIAKSIVKTKSSKYAITVDAGIGPDFMTAGGFKEQSLDGITLPDNAFSSRTSTVFSATAALGIKFNNVFGKAPLECGYRFFYLGQGNFNKQTNQLVNTLTTGNNYANALICAVTV